MTRDQFVNLLVTKYYQSEPREQIKFDDGSVITSELLGKILDSMLADTKRRNQNEQSSYCH